MKRKGSELKKMARASLSGRYAKAIGAILIYLLIGFGINLLTTFFMGRVSNIPLTYDATYYMKTMLPILGMDIIVSILLQIFLCGLYKFFLNFTRQTEYKISDLFYGFTHNPDRIIVANIVQFALYFIVILPAIMIMTLSIINPNYILLGLLMMFIDIGLIIMLSYRYLLSPFLLMDNENMGGIESLRISAQLMKGHKGRMFLISLSFIGWEILTIFTLGIGQLWLLPYITITTVFFYMERIGELDPPTPEPDIEIPDFDTTYYTDNDYHA
ncbi:MAG: DUF975 family protein [Lachnospiraceae bacterium]|jgi:uncharacterized membrane protein